MRIRMLTAVGILPIVLLLGVHEAYGRSGEPSAALPGLKTCYQRPSSSKGERPPGDLAGLINSLRARGVTVGRAGEVSQPFFSVRGRIITVSGEDVQVFEYRSAAAARREARRVEKTGKGTGTSMVTWIAPPHFYRSGKLIVLYVGKNGDVMKALEAVLGRQFAGS